MAKCSKAKRPSPMGKGKVTAVQIAFIVERFLADNNYANTLAAFRSEASDLFSKTKGKEVPKGLLGLGDILDEYISLKAQRMMVDQEKQRVEVAFQGLRDVMRAYQSPQSPPLLPPPQIMMAVAANPSGGSPPQGHMIHGSFVNHAQPSTHLPKLDETNKFSTPIPNSLSSGKRNASSSAPNVPPPPKRHRVGSSKDSHVIQDNIASGKLPCTNNTQANRRSTSAVIQGSSIAKRLFNNPNEARANSSSPKTPPQALQCQNDISLTANCASSSQNKFPSNCAIISSETIIISPLKQKGYYSVERRQQVSASPLKLSPGKMNKREHVKGRLDFDESCVPQSSEELLAIESSPSTTDGEATTNFDFDITDFDFFDGDFSNLLGDIDLDCEQGHSSQQCSAPVDFAPCLEQNQVLPNNRLSTVTEIISQKDMNIQDIDTMTSMRSITKRIMISSPSKANNSC